MRVDIEQNTFDNELGQGRNASRQSEIMAVRSNLLAFPHFRCRGHSATLPLPARGQVVVGPHPPEGLFFTCGNVLFIVCVSTLICFFYSSLYAPPRAKFITALYPSCSHSNRHRKGGHETVVNTGGTIGRGNCFPGK